MPLYRKVGVFLLSNDVNKTVSYIQFYIQIAHYTNIPFSY